MAEKMPKESVGSPPLFVGYDDEGKPIFEPLDGLGIMVCSKGKNAESQFRAVLDGMVSSLGAVPGESKKLYLLWGQTNLRQTFQKDMPGGKPESRDRELLLDELAAEVNRRIDYLQKNGHLALDQDKENDWPWLVVFIRYPRRCPLSFQEFILATSQRHTSIKVKTNFSNFSFYRATTAFLRNCYSAHDKPLFS